MTAIQSIRLLTWNQSLLDNIDVAQLDFCNASYGKTTSHSSIRLLKSGADEDENLIKILHIIHQSEDEIVISISEGLIGTFDLIFKVEKVLLLKSLREACFTDRRLRTADNRADVWSIRTESIANLGRGEEDRKFFISLPVMNEERFADNVGYIAFRVFMPHVKGLLEMESCREVESEALGMMEYNPTSEFFHGFLNELTCSGRVTTFRQVKEGKDNAQRGIVVARLMMLRALMRNRTSAQGEEISDIPDHALTIDTRWFSGTKNKEVSLMKSYIILSCKEHKQTDKFEALLRTLVRCYLHKEGNRTRCFARYEPSSSSNSIIRPISYLGNLSKKTVKKTISEQRGKRKVDKEIKLTKNVERPSKHYGLFSEERGMISELYEPVFEDYTINIAAIETKFNNHLKVKTVLRHFDFEGSLNRIRNLQDLKYKAHEEFSLCMRRRLKKDFFKPTGEDAIRQLSFPEKRDMVKRKINEADLIRLRIDDYDMLSINNWTFGRVERINPRIREISNDLRGMQFQGYDALFDNQKGKFDLTKGFKVLIESAKIKLTERKDKSFAPTE